MLTATGWTKVNLLYFTDSIEIASLERLTVVAQKLTNQNSHWHGDARFSWPEDNDLPLRCRRCLFLTCSYRDNPFFFTQCDIFKTYLKTGKIQDREHFEILGSKHSLI